ncbi:MAG: isoprenyl transferase [Firmicutes bacterium]|nr:isoprenyl transferase [Bacillota bacterium]
MAWWKKLTGISSKANTVQLTASTGDAPACRQWDKKQLPQHVAIIMDGNGRWATARGLVRSNGHRAGVEALKKTVREAHNLGIAYLTVYAFSTENWRRPQSEIDFLFYLLSEGLRTEIDELVGNDVKIRVLGDLTPLPESLQEAVAQAVKRTEGNDGLRLQIALNYGGRSEIVEACRRVCQKVLAGELNPDELTEEGFASFLYTAEIPDPDLVIRTGGEMRLSNFLLWQSAYSELVVTDLFWPDFDGAALRQAIDCYVRRERRFGGLG